MAALLGAEELAGAGDVDDGGEDGGGALPASSWSGASAALSLARLLRALCCFNSIK